MNNEIKEEMKAVELNEDMLEDGAGGVIMMDNDNDRLLDRTCSNCLKKIKISSLIQTCPYCGTPWSE